MKRLVIALQRIGDILMLIPTLRAIKQEHPVDCLHLLIHRECQVVEPVLQGLVDEVHFFERDKWQKSVGDLRLSGLEGHEQLKILVNQLIDLQFEAVYNLSHTKLSAQLTDLVSKQGYYGAKVDSFGESQFSSQWFKDLDENSEHNELEKFHFADYMFQGSGLGHVPQTVVKNESLAADGLAIQLLTSDDKKNFALKKWEQFLTLLAQVRPNLKVTLLAAPFEKQLVSDWVSALVSVPLKISLVCDDLKTTSQILTEHKLLITGDTSIKHLAASVGVPVLEIALGSSDVNFTGAMATNSLIIKPRTKCFPCPARTACSQPEHLCSHDVDVEALVMIATQMMEGMTTQFKSISDEFRGQFTLIKPYRTKDGLWHPTPIAERFSLELVEAWVQRALKSFQFTSAKGGNIASYAELLRKIYPFASQRDWQQIFSDIVFPQDKDAIKKEFVQCLKLLS